MEPVLSRWESRATIKPLSIKRIKRPELAHVRADCRSPFMTLPNPADRCNLVGNALKFESGKLWWRPRLRVAPGLIFCSPPVRDTGVGIAAEKETYLRLVHAG
jgi:hypothetical protein